MISDAALTEAAFAVDQAMLDAMPKPETCSHVFSPAFERKMRKLIRKTNHPIVYKVLSRAACALLALILSASLLLALNPEARAAVADWIKEKVEDFYQYYPKKTPGAVLPGEYCLGWIPEGCTLEWSKISDVHKVECYVDASGNYLKFLYLSSSTSGSLLVGGGEYVEKYVKIGNLRAEIYLAKDSRNSNAIIWYTDNGQTLFFIDAYLSEADLIKIAESVYLQENN